MSNVLPNVMNNKDEMNIGHELYGSSELHLNTVIRANKRRRYLWIALLVAVIFCVGILAGVIYHSQTSNDTMVFVYDSGSDALTRVETEYRMSDYTFCQDYANDVMLLSEEKLFLSLEECMAECTTSMQLECIACHYSCSIEKFIAVDSCIEMPSSCGSYVIYRYLTESSAEDDIQGENMHYSFSDLEAGFDGQDSLDSQESQWDESESAWEESWSEPDDTDSEQVVLVTFDALSDTMQDWYTVDDPVMGGSSSSDFYVDEQNQIGVWYGTVRIVSFLGAAGFCLAKTEETTFPDCTGATSFTIRARTEGDIDEFYWDIQTAGNSEYTVYQTTFELPNDGEWHEVSTSIDDFYLTHYGYTINNGMPFPEELHEITQIGIAAESEGDFEFQIEWISVEMSQEQEQVETEPQTDMEEKEENSTCDGSDCECVDQDAVVSDYCEMYGVGSCTCSDVALFGWCDYLSDMLEGENLCPNACGTCDNDTDVLLGVLTDDTYCAEYSSSTYELADDEGFYTWEECLPECQDDDACIACYYSCAFDVYLPVETCTEMNSPCGSHVVYLGNQDTETAVENDVGVVVEDIFSNVHTEEATYCGQYASGGNYQPTESDSFETLDECIPACEDHDECIACYYSCSFDKHIMATACNEKDSGCGSYVTYILPIDVVVEESHYCNEYGSNSGYVPSDEEKHEMLPDCLEACESNQDCVACYYSCSFDTFITATQCTVKPSGCGSYIVYPTDTSIDLVSFDSTSPLFTNWETVNDPVMGGTSDSEVFIDFDKQVGVWQGHVEVVSFLGEAGFCLVQTEDSSFPDITGAAALSIRARVEGVIHGFEWYIQTKGNTYGSVYMSDFDIPNDGEWHEATSFIDDFDLSYWGYSLGGGNSFESELFEIKQIGILAETEGEFYVEIDSIRAIF